MYENLSLEEKVQLALENSEKAKADSARARDYYEIQKVWSAHSYCYRAEWQRFEIENYWSKEHDDIIYAHGDRAYMGRELVTKYYAEGNEIMLKGKLELMSKLFPDEVENIPENLGVGDLVFTMQTTPYIEIAEDGQTAKGVWYCAGMGIEIDKNGEPVGSWSVAKECVDFVKEQGGWKIWHFSASPEFGAPLDKEILIGKREQLERTVPGAFPETNVSVVPLPFNMYSPKRPAKFSPELPRPYETWDESLSFTKLAE